MNFRARDLEILRAVVQEYIETGEPVASRTLAKHRKAALSPASIRNIMADLEDEGYLSQPHTSAGRVPTGLAFRLYVESLTASQLPASEAERVRAELLGAATLDGRLERSTHVLQELTHNLAVTAAVSRRSQLLDQLELLQMSDQRVLIIVVTKDGMVHNRVVAPQETISADELVRIRNYFNENFRGWTIPAARRELARRLEQESAAYNDILRRLLLLDSLGLLDIGQEPQVHTEGVSNLLSAELNLTRERMRALFRALEETKKILSLLDLYLEQPSGEVTVQVGLGAADPAMEELSLIGISMTLPSGQDARFAVIGPTRMQYPKVMSTVYHVGQVFQNLPVA